MREYFLGLILFAFLGSAILSVAPCGVAKGYLRFLCGLCGIGCIIFPIFSILGSETGERADFEALFEANANDEDNYVEIYNSFFDESVLLNAEASLKNQIISELNASNEDFELKIIVGYNSDEKYIKRVRVNFYPSGYSIDPKRIEKICFSSLGCECEFFYY